MAAIGGPIETVSLNGREFTVAADADSNRDLGGFSNEVMPNGDGTARLIKTRVAWRVDGLALVIDDARGDQEFIQSLANSNDYFAIAITYPSGVIYQGTGQIVEDRQSSSQSATMPIILAGQGVLAAQ